MFFCFSFYLFYLLGRGSRSSACLRSWNNHEDLHATTEAEHQMECRLLLNVVVRKGLTILELLARKDQALLIRRDALLILNLLLHILDAVARLNIYRDRLTRECLHENLHAAATETQDQMECRLLLNIVVRKSLAILKLLAREDQALLIRRDALLVLNLLLNILNAITRLNIERDRLASKSLNENLHFVCSSLV